MEEALVIYSDGGARGNPGPGACAFVIEEGSRVVAKGSKYLGRVTNNFAEYSGVLLALQAVTKKSTITFYLDSELVAKQLSGLYKVKNKDLLKLAIEIRALVAAKSLEISFVNIPREKNKVADQLVNEELDRNISG
jgi:ribonuclease HI